MSGWDPEACLKNIVTITGCQGDECLELVCPPEACAEALRQQQLHSVCTCQAPYLNGCANNPRPGCCAYGPYSPVAVAGGAKGFCYCCCGGNARGQWNAVDADEIRPLAAFVEGDTVYVAEDGSLQKWSQRSVSFKGSAPVAAGVMVRARFRRGEREVEVLAHRDQPFLLPDRTLRRAGKLVPGVDSLVEADGTPVPVLAVEDAPDGEVHHLATSRAPAASVDGHLVLVNGVVAGDYALQLADLNALNARALAMV
jgi:hypothetical protein